MITDHDGLYEFGPFRLDLPKRLLTRNGQPVQLKPKTFDLLVLLVSARGRLLTKAELMKSLWAETFVEEANLSFQISTLRKALGDEGAHWIETVPKHGYRFTLDVRTVEHGPRDRPIGSPLLRRHWIGIASTSLCLATVIAWSLRGREPAVAQFDRITPLTTYPGQETHPSFSPDGSHLAFAWDGERQDNLDIYTKAIGPDDTPLRVTIDPAEDRFPAWSPQGGEIAFLRGGAIYVVPPSPGGVERKLANVSALSPMSWSPDGKFIFASQSTTGDQPGGIVLVPVRGDQPRRLTTAEPGHGHENPVLAPDARSLAFLSCYERSIASCNAYVVQLDSNLMPVGEPRQETRGQTCSMCGLAWTSDARSLVYGVEIGVYGLWRVNVTGVDVPRQIAIGPDQSCWPAISTRTRRLVYSKFTSGSDIWLWERNGSKGKLIDSTRHEGLPQFSPDGTRIVFVSDRSGLTNVWVANADGSTPARLTPASRYSSTPRWSPDGNWIAYDEQDPDDGDWNVFIVDSSGHRARPLVDHPANDSVPSWSHDGKWIYFTSNRHGGVHEIFRMPASGGKAVQLTDAGGFVAFESVDGRTLYYTKTASGPSPLFARAIAGGPERQILDSVYNRGFAVSDDAIYYIQQDSAPGAFLIKAFEFSSGKSRQLTRIEGPDMRGITVSPDKQKILYDLDVRSSADLMLAESFR